jgi:hypothetical protein
MNYAKVHIMQKERDPLNLSSLPSVAPLEDGWPPIRAALEQRQRRQRWTRYSGSALGVAAALMLAVGLFVQQPVTEEVSAPPQALESLVSLSQQLENRIRTYRSEVGDLPTEALVYQVELEDLVAQVDEELSMNPESTELWSQRINLMLDLSRIYQDQLRRDYSRIASL